MISKLLAKKILNILLKSGGDFSELYIQKKITNSIRLEDSKIENSSSGYELGCGLRLWTGESTFYAYVDSLQEDKLVNAAKVLSSAVDGSSRNKVLDLTSAKSSYHTSIKRYPGEVNLQSKKKMLLEVDKTSRDYSTNIFQVTSNLSDLEEEVYIANSEGINSYDKIIKTILTVSVIARKGKDVRTGYKSLARTCG